jgi:hypothetical protein
LAGAPRELGGIFRVVYLINTRKEKMFETGVYHVSEAGRIPSASLQTRLSAEQYGQALDHLVITCVDLVFTHQETILLAQRNKYPRKSW